MKVLKNTKIRPYIMNQLGVEQSLNLVHSILSLEKKLKFSPEDWILLDEFVDEIKITNQSKLN